MLPPGVMDHLIVLPVECVRVSPCGQVLAALKTVGVSASQWFLGTKHHLSTPGLGTIEKVEIDKNNPANCGSLH